jgi:isopentenyl diphosphate isomerase/L-lactate dehydrogenase-like FMN-dependent dehydrogenase
LRTMKLLGVKNIKELDSKFVSINSEITKAREVK